MANIFRELLAGCVRIAITARASTPETLVRQVLASLDGFGMLSIAETSHIRETVTFLLAEGLEKQGENALNDIIVGENA